MDHLLFSAKPPFSYREPPQLTVQIPLLSPLSVLLSLLKTLGLRLSLHKPSPRAQLVRQLSGIMEALSGQQAVWGLWKGMLWRRQEPPHEAPCCIRVLPVPVRKRAWGESTVLPYQMRWASWDRMSDTCFFTITPQPQLPYLGPMRDQTR